jgi:hypothetical protein
MKTLSSPPVHRTELTAPMGWALRSLGVLLLCGPVAAQELVNGGVVRGTLSTPGQQDTYTFTAQSNNWFELRAVDVDGSAFTPRIEVHNPRGDLLLAGSGAEVAVIDSTRIVGFPDTPPGTYTVVVSNADGVRAPGGTYDLHFVLAPGANAGGELQDGVMVFGEIQPGELDSYAFTVLSGQTVTGTIAPLGESSLRLRVELFSATGHAVGVGGTVHFTLSPSQGGIQTLVVSDGSDGAAGTGRYSIVFHGVAAMPPYPPSVYWPSEFRSDPFLLDVGGDAGLGPRAGDPAEPFNVSIDCTGADAPSIYALAVTSGLQPGASHPWGLLYLQGPRLLRTLGHHQRSVETWFPEPTGLPVPADPALVGTSFTVQGVCGGIDGSLRLSNAITQTIGG